MKIKTWNSEFTVKELKDLAYWERNVLALHFADPSKGDGWYYDQIKWSEAQLSNDYKDHPGFGVELNRDSPVPRYPGLFRVISLQNGSITFHVTDDFDLGNLPEIERNWDGHTTEQKWSRMLSARGVEVEK